MVVAPIDQIKDSPAPESVSESASRLDREDVQTAAPRKKQSLWKRISLNRTKSSEPAAESSPGRFRALLGRKSGEDQKERAENGVNEGKEKHKGKSFHVIVPDGQHKLTKQHHVESGASSIVPNPDDSGIPGRPSISAPIPESLRVLTPDRVGDDVMRSQENRSDRLAGQHVDSKFHEDIK